jgi:3-mercaptopyruvate sulfurtransferase SseA
MHRRTVLLLCASLAAAALFACSKQGGATPSHELNKLTVDQVAARIAAHDGKTYIFDDNPKERWVKGHVPGAKWLDEDHVTAADLPADKTATLIFYCHNET